MGILEFVIVLLLVVTAGRVLSRRHAVPLPRESFNLDAEELHRLRETIADLGTRMERLEEERDFYKDLLDPPPDRDKLPPPDSNP